MNEWDAFPDAPEALSGNADLWSDFPDAPSTEQVNDAVDVSEVNRGAGRTGRSMATGAASLLDIPRIITNPILHTAGAAADLVGADGVRDWAYNQVNAPYIGDMTRGAIDKATGNAYAPRNTTEKVADFGSEFATAMMTPAVMQKLGVAGINALNSAGDKVKSLFSGSKDIDKGTQRAVNVLLEEGKTPEEIIAFAQQAKQQPIPTTLFEQAQSPKGLSIQRVLAEQPNQAGSELSAFNKARVTETIPQTAQAVASAGAETTSPLVSGTKIKTIADDIIKEAIESRKAITKPLYEVDKNIPVVLRIPAKEAKAGDAAYLGMEKGSKAVPEQVIPMIDRLSKRNPAINAAMRRVDTDPTLQQLLKSEGIKRESAGYLEKVRGELSRVANVSMADVTKLDRQAAAGAKNGMKVLDRVLEKYAPGVIKARTEFAALSPEVTALQKGIVGRIATAKSPEKAAEMIMQEAPETIKSVRAMFLKKDPQAWRDLTSSMLNQKALLAEDSLAKYLGAVDRALVKPKMQAMLTPAQYRAQRMLIANLRAIQKGLPRNSETVAKTLAAAELEGSGMAENIAQRISRGGGAKDAVSDLLLWLTRSTQAKFSQQSKLALSRAITDPSIEALGKELARLRPGSKAATDLIETYMLPYIAATAEAPKLMRDSAPKMLESKPQSSLAPTPEHIAILKGNPKLAAQQVLNPTAGLPVGQQALPQDLINDEGSRSFAYMDTTGNKTVGIGFNMDSGIAKQIWKQAGVKTPFRDVYQGKVGITEAEQVALAHASYQVARSDAASLFPKFDKLSENRKQALLNLSYQMGAERLGGFKNFRMAMNEGDYRMAARELVRSEWFKQTQDSRKNRIIQQIAIG